jgi:multiple antibiotic resistance protein
MDKLPFDLLLALLFNLMGPIGVIPRFAAITGGVEADARRRIAFLAGAASLVAILIAITLGAWMLGRFQIDKGSLVIAAGLVLLVASLRNIYPPAPSSAEAAGGASRVPIAVSPIAVPGVVTPSAVGVLIIFAAYFPSFDAIAAIFGAVLGIMALNVAAMIYAQAFMARIGMAPLVVLGAVFGILQVALAIQMIVSGARTFSYGA